jgi:hypothetical protein
MTRVINHIKSQAIAYAALFVALGGTSWAAINLPAGSVGAEQLRNGSVTARKLGKQAVTAASLDPKSIAGHVALWAQIRADGKVTSSSPRATVVTNAPRGLEQVYWHRAISSRCLALANPTNVAPITESATAYATGPYGHGRGAYFFVSTFDGTGANVPENVNVVVICP